MKNEITDNESVHWFVMRDLKRLNAKLPAYKQLRDMDFELFTPMKWQLVSKGGKQVRMEVPYIQDLLFVHSTRERLDPVVGKTPTLQYRYQHGKSYREPMTVREADMERFMYAVNHADVPRYFMPDELTPAMYGRKVRIVGGALDNYEGYLLAVRGGRTKHLLVELPGFLTVSVEVSPEYIQLL